jgi:hypothetical protein
MRSRAKPCHRFWHMPKQASPPWRGRQGYMRQAGSLAELSRPGNPHGIFRAPAVFSILVDVTPL